jgi:rod shape-determining protein MreC
MREIIRFITKHHLFFLFLLFETLSFYLLVNYNHHHNQTFINSSGKLTASILEVSGNFSEYFSLKKANEELSRENAYLRTQLPENNQINNQDRPTQNSYGGIYNYTSARVVNNSVNKLNNYITINKGSNHGIVAEMGVISARGLVGIVRHVSPNYSTVLSLLNTHFKASAKLRDSNFFGSLEWSGSSFEHAILSEIPAHANMSVGDAVVTSGYSAIFPEGILIGTIEDFNLREGEGFYQIIVKLSVDFKSLAYVEVVEKTTKAEQKELEKTTAND